MTVFLCHPADWQHWRQNFWELSSNLAMWGTRQICGINEFCDS